MPTSYPSLFNDVFGPVMQPGSSSHTAGPCRLGYLANALLGEVPVKVEVLLDEQGSFAGTLGLMAEDLAMLAGALGMLPDDSRLYEARRLAEETGVEFRIEFGSLSPFEHPNSVLFRLTGVSGRRASLLGESTGGGMIRTRLLNGFPLETNGDAYLVLAFANLDEHELAARLDIDKETVLEAGSRMEQGEPLAYLRASEAPDGERLRALPSSWQTVVLPPVLPVATPPQRRARLFGTMAEWRELARAQDVGLWELAVQYEMRASGWDHPRVLAYMSELARLMRRQTRAPYEEDLTPVLTPFRPDFAAEWQRHAGSPARLTDELTAATIRWAYGAGAGIAGVATVPGPMGSGGGYLYAALSAVQERQGFSEEDLLHGLFVAGGVALIAFIFTDPTGEAVGCTGECGISGAMAAAGLVEMAGGQAAQAEHAASLALQAFMGLPCDPIPGGMSQPCRSRILLSTTSAVMFADLALAGRDAVLPFHEAVAVADAVGRALPRELLCTSAGGCAAAPTALERAAEFKQWQERIEREGAPRPPGNLI